MAWLLVVKSSDQWLAGGSAPVGRKRRAAIAIRDNVSPFEKWGSRAFTWRQLRRGYSEAWYFTQAHRGDCRREFVATLDDALRRYECVDLFLLAHTNHYVSWVEEIPAERRARLRLVYNTGCFNLAQSTRWQQLGAQSYVGHRGDSASAIYYFYLLRRWTRDWTLEPAMADSAARLNKVLATFEPFYGWRFGSAGKVIAESEAECLGSSRLSIASTPP